MKRVGALGAGRTKMKMEEGGSSSMRIDSELADRLHTNDASMSCNLNALESKLDALLAASESPPSTHQDGGNLAQSPVPFHLEETPGKAPPRGSPSPCLDNNPCGGAFVGPGGWIGPPLPCRGTHAEPSQEPATPLHPSAPWARRASSCGHGATTASGHDRRCRTARRIRG